MAWLLLPCIRSPVVSNENFGSIISSNGSPGQVVNYLYLVEGPFSLFACLAALLSAFSLLLMILSSCSSKLDSRPSCALSRGHSGILSSKRHQCCLYGQAQQQLWWRLYPAFWARSRSLRSRSLARGACSLGKRQCCNHRAFR